MVVVGAASPSEENVAVEQEAGDVIASPEPSTQAEEITQVQLTENVATESPVALVVVHVPHTRLAVIHEEQQNEEDEEFVDLEPKPFLPPYNRGL